MTAHARIARIARQVLHERYVSIEDQADAMAAAIITEGLTQEWTWLVAGSYGYGQGSIFPSYEQAKARKSDAVILSSHRTPWTRVEERAE